ncbi:metal-dependent hydrolase [Oceanotoga teriensis]|uniref:UPF0173 metal-dependent hydrolase C7380_101172 n=1 Tax=Oceanotoga teriensis TaxID=515440 RepID=A0AA45HJQ8_9BACT|nr:metal-dependent hydrolase [Oceanotoga teriensis]MDO7977131.1 metal-dependent hydrolase [Oceanotoga teriensis]PWJ96598.1 L-ascorbate metabolism protein UlaG (beta-lactamase superfamily) [Oceanotoga teriensis]
MKIENIGHSAFYIQSIKNIIIDPFITGNTQAKKNKDDFEKIDYILITHGHDDHIGDSIYLAKKTNAKIICNFEIALYLQKVGLQNIHPMHIGGSYKFEFGKVKMTSALHGSSIIDGNEIIYAGNPCGYLIEIENKKIYHAGDTGLSMEMHLLKTENIDIALLPIGGNYVMDIDDAIKAVEIINPKFVIPMHFNTWDIIRADKNLFKSKVESLGKKFLNLNPGEILDF